MTRDQAAGLTLGILTGALLTRWWAPRLAHAIAGTPHAQFQDVWDDELTRLGQGALRG